MATPVEIKDGRGTARSAVVTSIGELVVAPVAYDEVVSKEVGTANVATSFYLPKVGQQFVITAIRLKADRDVSPTNDATVVVYEASSISSTVVDKTLFTENLIKAESADLSGVRILVTEGKFVNVKTTDDDIFGTIIGYYVDVIS